LNEISQIAVGRDHNLDKAGNLLGWVSNPLFKFPINNSQE
jgi:hypothetical protein